ncbi:hypothetical protein DPMN_103039 [Dreissena polymorpha]|uniref:Uncharacterized protein n=1 Tax=Dreissena polymorpha TaxID=45954 RepID=A0A9D4H7C0_DREPO|nr:hypothetical protein DPMN_103039 [Dreissena polymorpha]
MADTSSPAVAEKTIFDEIKAETPKCWRTLYHMLELYSTIPETKTIQGFFVFNLHLEMLVCYNKSMVQISCSVAFY